MDIERSFVFAFKVPGAAKKLLLGGVFTLLFFTVFFAFAVMGYLMQVLCNTLEGRDASLPEWDDLPGLFNQGLLPGLIVLIYSSPLFVLLIIEPILFFAIGPGSGLSWALLGVLLLARLAICIGISLLLPLALVRFAVKGSLGSALEFGHLFAFIKQNPGLYFTAWGLSLAVGVVTGLGTVALVVGVAFTLFIGNVITVHLYASAYRAAVPFSDDKEADVRASMALPPPLK